MVDIAATLGVTYNTIHHAYYKIHKKHGETLIQDAKDAGTLDAAGHADEDTLPKPCRRKVKEETSDDDVLHGMTFACGLFSLHTDAILGVASGRVGKGKTGKGKTGK